MSGFITGSLIPHIIGSHGIASTASYIVHTATPYVIAHPVAGVAIGGVAVAGATASYIVSTKAYKATSTVVKNTAKTIMKKLRRV